MTRLLNEWVNDSISQRTHSRLGLGAKYLPHKLVAQQQSAALEKKLQRSLKRTAQDQDEGMHCSVSVCLGACMMSWFADARRIVNIPDPRD